MESPPPAVEKAPKETAAAEDTWTLKDAEKTLSSLKGADFKELKAMESPPEAVTMTMSALCILLDVKPEKVTKDDGKKVDDYWEPAKKDVLGDTKILSRLKSFDKDNIPETTLRRLGPFIKKKSFTPEEVKKSSTACAGICQWIRAVNAYAKSKPKATEAKPEKPAAKEKAKKGEKKEKAPEVPAAEADALKEAEKALKGVKGKDLKELKAMETPPEAVKMTVSALCVLLGEKPEKVENEDGKKVDDYWELGKKVLGDTKMISNLLKFDKDSIPE